MEVGGDGGVETGFGAEVVGDEAGEVIMAAVAEGAGAAGDLVVAVAVVVVLVPHLLLSLIFSLEMTSIATVQDNLDVGAVLTTLSHHHLIVQKEENLYLSRIMTGYNSNTL